MDMNKKFDEQTDELFDSKLNASDIEETEELSDEALDAMSGGSWIIVVGENTRTGRSAVLGFNWD